MFWTLVIIVAALLSVATLNPIPIGLALAVALAGKLLEAPQVVIIKAAGDNPDLPKPNSGAGCIAFLIAVVLFGFLALVVLGVVATIIEGGKL